MHNLLSSSSSSGSSSSNCSDWLIVPPTLDAHLGHFGKFNVQELPSTSTTCSNSGGGSSISNNRWMCGSCLEGKCTRN